MAFAYERTILQEHIICLTISVFGVPILVCLTRMLTLSKDITTRRQEAYLGMHLIH